MALLLSHYAVQNVSPALDQLRIFSNLTVGSTTLMKPPQQTPLPLPFSVAMCDVMQVPPLYPLATQY